MQEGLITTTDGRSVGFADFGVSAGETAVVWCHGGPGSRLEAGVFATAAIQDGLRLVGIDRPGYGRSTPQPGRTIGAWVSDALAVVDHLGIETFVAAGLSTGGAYALALAARSNRVTGAVAGCALSDMRWQEGRAMVPDALAVWQTPNRDSALALVAQIFGAHGEKMSAFTDEDAIAPSDAAMLANPGTQLIWQHNVVECFAQGVCGYTDDRLADGDGWGTFDVNAITCPVTVLHGTSDTVIPVAHAYHTARIVPGATLQIFDRLGHFSIASEVLPAINQMLARLDRAPMVSI